MLSKLVEVHFNEGKEIIKEGANNNTFYVIKSGEAAVTKAGTAVTTLKSGGFFGERALLKDEPASATIVVAKGGLACYQCDRATFNAVLGSLQELLDNETKRRDRMDAKKGVVEWTGLEVRPLHTSPYIPLCPPTSP